MFDLTYDPSVMSGNLVYFIAAWFLFILIFSDERYRVHAFIIGLASIININTNGLVDSFTYVQDVSISILFDGATALILTMFLVFDKLAVKQSLLLAFAVLCHTMIIYDLTIASSIFSNFFYTWYDELIIVVGLLQMGVSYNGFITALSNLQKLLPRIVFYSHGVNKSLPTRKERETKA